MIRRCLRTSTALAIITAAPLAAQRPGIAALDSAIGRMGGAERLASITRIRLDMLTQWLQLGFSSRPLPEVSSYERHTDLRDYESRSWRNTRQFFGAPPGSAVVSLVVDTVAALGRVTANQPVAWGPLSLAYVVERRELFAFAPERMLLNARAASPRSLPDTTIDGAAHARVSATIDGFPATFFIRRGDWTTTLVRFRADETADFGLAPWGEMDVEFWFSGWRTTGPGLLYPMHWDVLRVGRPYKRMTVLSAAFNPPASPDSFAIADSVRSAYFATQQRPMWDVPLDSARIDGAFMTFGSPFLGSSGAVRIGGAWVLLETGQAPDVARRLVAVIGRLDAGSRVAGALATPPRTANGGATWLASQRIPVWHGTGARPFITRMAPAAAAGTVQRGRWQRVATDSLWLESIDLPDFPGTLVAYSPTLRWAYSSAAVTPINLSLMLAHLRSRGFAVERYGSSRAVTTAIPPQP